MQLSSLPSALVAVADVSGRLYGNMRDDADREPMYPSRRTNHTPCFALFAIIRARRHTISGALRRFHSTTSCSLPTATPSRVP